MKKAILFVAALATLVSLGSCSDEKKYQEFAGTFAEAVSKGDTAVVKQMMKGGDKLLLSGFEMAPITAGSLQMEALQSEGYKMTWGDKIAIVQPNGDKLVAMELYKIFSCKDNARLEVAKKLNLIKSDENIATIEAVCSEEVTKELANKKTAEVASLNSIPETFYKKSFKAVPVLPSFTQGFGDIMRRTQAEAGYNGIKGYISYCFWQDWVGASDTYISSYTTSGYSTESIDDTHATVSVHLVMKLEKPEGSGSLSFSDKFVLVKIGDSWKIDDIIRDGKSLRAQFNTYRPYIP